MVLPSAPSAARVPGILLDAAGLTYLTYGKAVDGETVASVALPPLSLRYVVTEEISVIRTPIGEL